jgi:ABC-2 type transport system permease protein
MKAFTHLVIATLREYSRDRMAIFWTFAFIGFFILVFGLIFGREYQFTATIGLVAEEQGIVEGTLKQAFKEAGVFKVREGVGEEQLDLLKKGEMDAVLIIPPGASTAIERGETAPIALHYDGSREQVLETMLPLIKSVLQETERRVRPASKVFELEASDVRTERLRPIQLFLPGLLAMSLMQLGLFATSMPLISLRAQGVLRHLGATPLPRLTVLASHVCVRVLIAILQMSIVLILGTAFFNMRITGSWLMFALVMLFGAITFIAIGFLIAAVSRTEETGNLIASTLQIPMIFLSGILFPVETVPEFLHPIMNAMPTTSLADMLRQVMIDAPPSLPLITNSMALAVWLIVSSILAVRFFKWE